MSDIFISYSSADRERARVVAHALEARGWSVWWDREIPPGRAFDDVIEEALDAAHCVIVLWSKASTASSWVRNEASDAMGRKVLIPALIDSDVKIPLEFRRLQAADLSRWQGDDSVEFQQFCEAVAHNVAAAATAPPRAGPAPAPARAPAPAPPPSVAPPMQAPSAASAPPAKSKSAKTLWIGGGVALLVLAGLAALMQDIDPPLGNVAPPLGNGVPPLGSATPPLGSTTPPLGGAAAMANLGSGLSTNLTWYDHALTYAGTLTWDGRSNMAQLSVDVFDAATRQGLGHRQVAAYGHPDAPGRNVFSAQIPVNGDSVTPGPHTHNVNLVFEQQSNGNWLFVRNCSAPNDCYEVRH